VFAEPAPAGEAGLGELDHLLGLHPAPALQPEDLPGLPVYEQFIPVLEARPPVRFLIPGFQKFGCAECHRPEELAAGAAERLKKTITQIERFIPDTQPVPVKQYIIQPYTDDLLRPGQLAHATFDTIRIFPAAVIIDARAYGGQTHLHETLHLAQPFLGHVNELEAYGLNVRSDPRFLLLNYPYFSDVVQVFFEPGLKDMIRHWFERGVREDRQVPREVQWFLMGFDEEALARLKKAVTRLVPVLEAASRLYRERPWLTAYLSEQTGVRSLVLDLAAVQRLDLPPLGHPDKREAAFDVFDRQMMRDDNTRLGYVIDRKQEALMTLKYTTGPKDPQERLALYFHYLKARFFDEEGNLKLEARNPEDFKNFLERKRRDLQRMAAYPALTPIERQGALRLVEQIGRRLAQESPP